MSGNKSALCMNQYNPKKCLTDYDYLVSEACALKGKMEV